MQPARSSASRVVVAALAAAAVALAAGPAASAKAKLPERPKKAVAVKRITPHQSLGRASVSAETLFLGYDSYSGLEVYVTRVDGRIVGLPYG